VPFGLLNERENGSGALAKLGPRLGGRNAARMAADEGSGQMLLEGLDLQAQRGGGDVQGFGRARHAAGLNDRNEISELPQRQHAASRLKPQVLLRAGLSILQWTAAAACS